MHTENNRRGGEGGGHSLSLSCTCDPKGAVYRDDQRIRRRLPIEGDADVRGAFLGFPTRIHVKRGKLREAGGPRFPQAEPIFAKLKRTGRQAQLHWDVGEEAAQEPRKDVVPEFQVETRWKATSKAHTNIHVDPQRGVQHSADGVRAGAINTR